MTDLSIPEIAHADRAAADATDAEMTTEVLKLVPKSFSIDCENHANWLVRKVVEARHYARRVKEWAEQEQRRAAREEQTLLFLFGSQIEAWTKDQIERMSGRRKSICLPAGTVGFRSLSSRLVIDDESVVLAWARKDLPSAIVVVEKLSKSVINDYAEKTGVIPDGGVHVEAANERFYIR